MKTVEAARCVAPYVILAMLLSVCAGCWYVAVQQQLQLSLWMIVRQAHRWVLKLISNTMLWLVLTGGCSALIASREHSLDCCAKRKLKHKAAAVYEIDVQSIAV
jgi:hypothetical protein